MADLGLVRSNRAHVSIPDANIDAAMRVLSTWNPLGERAASIPDLDGYRTEASDILVEFGMRESRQSAATVVQRILEEAFVVDVPRASCEGPAADLWRIHIGDAQ